MARGTKFGVLLTGSAQGAVKAIDLTAKNVEELGKTTTKVAKRVKESGDNIADAFATGAVKAAKWGAATALAGATATAALVKAGLQSADALAKTSDKLGVSTEALAKFRFAAEQTGVAQNKADIALQRFTRRLADAAAGTGPAVKAFQALNLSADELIKMSPDKAFAKVAEQMNKVENQSQKVSLAFKLFDSEGVDLVNTLALGEKGLAALGEEAEVLGLTLSRVDAAKIEQANDAMNRIGKAFSGLGQQLAVKFAPLLKVIADRLFEATKEAGGMGNVATRAFNAMAKSVGQFLNIFRFVSIQITEARIQLLKLAEIYFNFLKKVRDTLPNLPLPQIALFKKATEDVEGLLLTFESELTDARQKIDEIYSRPLPSDAVDEFVADVERASAEMADSVVSAQGEVQGAVLDTETVTASLATTTAETADKIKTSTEQVESYWDKAIQGTIERIDGAFADAWKNGIDSFEDFAANMKAGFSQLIAELAHMLITRPLIMNIGAAFGLGTAASTASAASGLGGIASGISAFGSNALSGLGSGFSSFGNFLGPTSFLGDAFGQLGTNITTGAYGIGTLGTSALAGFGGSYLGQQVFGGDTTGLGSLAGGIGGTAIGGLFGMPQVGAGVGAFIGEGIETAINKVFGIGGVGNNAAAAEFNLENATIESITWGNNGSDPGNVTASQELASLLIPIAQAIGGSTYSGRVQVGSKQGISLDGTRVANAEEFIDLAFRRIVEGAEQLDEVTKQILLSFEGTNDELAMFATSMVALSEGAKINAVAMAIEDFGNGSRTLSEVFFDNTQELAELIDNFDGSADSAVQLNAAFQQNKQAAYEFAIAIQQIGKSIEQSATAQAESIRESVLTEEQLQKKRQEEYEKLFVQLNNGLFDPNKIDETSRRLLELNQQIFSGLSEDQQKAQAEAFATNAENINETAQKALEDTLTAAQEAERSLNEQVLRAQREAADLNLETAQINQSAVQQFGTYIQALIANGIPVYAVGADSDLAQ